jgi:hypothetical protein
VSTIAMNKGASDAALPIIMMHDGAEVRRHERRRKIRKNPRRHMPARRIHSRIFMNDLDHAEHDGANKRNRRISGHYAQSTRESHQESSLVHTLPSQRWNM